MQKKKKNDIFFNFINTFYCFKNIFIIDINSPIVFFVVFCSKWLFNLKSLKVCLQILLTFTWKNFFQICRLVTSQCNGIQWILKLVGNRQGWTAYNALFSKKIKIWPQNWAGLIIYIVITTSILKNIRSIQEKNIYRQLHVFLHSFISSHTDWISDIFVFKLSMLRIAYFVLFHICLKK